MSVFWGLSISNDTLAECALTPYADQIGLRTGDAGAWGLGYYSRGDLLQRVEPKRHGEPLDISDIAHGIRTDLIVMHSRTATVGRVRPENVHPFRFNDWIFAHNGTFAGFEAIKDKICHAMPPFILRRLMGDTDSEHIFHLFLSFLYDMGLMGRPNVGIAQIRDALHRALATVDEFAGHVGEAPSAGSFIVSDGYSLVVLSRGLPVDYVLIEGIRDCSHCRKSIRPGEVKETRVDHLDVRAVLVSSEASSAPPTGFQRLNENAFLMVTKAHSVEFSAFS
ncbi:MAG: class II glutamine amidotransferase [Myxococcota bacterium]|nr:class II glutamine amidotransferase [Myxococcota bacterium]